VVSGAAEAIGAGASPVSTARSVCATRTASAFFRYTTCRLPPAAVGLSRPCTISWMRASRAGLSARTMRLLVRPSAATLMRPRASACAAASAA
jgi:hypothetical protein